MAGGMAIHIYFTQGNVTNLSERYVLNAIEVSLEKNLLKTTLTREGDLCYLVSEAVVQRCSVKKVHLKISQNSQENTCTRVSFLRKLQVSALQLY